MICSDLFDSLANHRFIDLFECCLAYIHYDQRKVQHFARIEKLKMYTVQIFLLGLLEFTLILVHINLTQLDLSTPIERAIKVYARVLQSLNFVLSPQIRFYMGYILKLLEVVKDRCTLYLNKHRESFHDAANGISAYLDPSFVGKPLTVRQTVLGDQVFRSGIGASFSPFSNPTINQSNYPSSPSYSEKLNTEMGLHRTSLETDDPNSLDDELQRRLGRLSRPLSQTFQEHKCFTDLHSKLYSSHYIEFTDAHASVRSFIERVLQHIYTTQ